MAQCKGIKVPLYWLPKWHPNQSRSPFSRAEQSQTKESALVGGNGLVSLSSHETIFPSFSHIISPHEIKFDFAEQDGKGEWIACIFHQERARSSFGITGKSSAELSTSHSRLRSYNLILMVLSIQTPSLYRCQTKSGANQAWLARKKPYRPSRLFK